MNERERDRERERQYANDESTDSSSYWHCRGLLRQEGQRAHYTISLDVSRTEERARLLAVINFLQKLKSFVIIQSSGYEEDSGVLDFIQTEFMHVERERWKVIEHPIFLD